MASSQGPFLGDLQHLINTCPVIDNHAHNILRPDQLKSANFLPITTEANGEALEDTPKSLSHLRAARQLRKLYGLSPDADWATILGKRAELLESDAEVLMKKCFKGTQTILIDDGLDSGANIEPYSWHDQFTRSPCRRIVRIETVAAAILSDLYQQAKLPIGVAIADEEACSLAWMTFVSQFEQAILSSLADDAVVGFKSVICYRTGLDIQTGRDIEVSEDGLRSFRRHYLPECIARNFRVEAKGMNDALVISVCKLIAAHNMRKGVAKPFQFHTGLGDNDISLLDSNPSCLQPLIKDFPTVPIVLLHSSYPYTREAGYLATVYKNVYLDIGEVFPMVSRDGQEKIVRQALELTPTSKILWSTDGHHFPETYWTANIQGREALWKVLRDYVENEDLTVAQAMGATIDIFFQNSNKLYSLELTLGEEIELEQQPRAANHLQDHNYHLNIDDHLLTNIDPEQDDSLSNGMRLLFRFQSKNPEVKFVVLQWLDYLGTLRSRWQPIESFTDMIRAGGRMGISKGNLGTLQNDHMTPVCDPVGQILVEPDLGSLRMLQLKNMDSDGNDYPPTATVMARFTDEAAEPLNLCPRSQLQSFVEAFQQEHDINLLVGFEIEINFCRWHSSSTAGVSTSNTRRDILEPLDTNHAWGSLTDEQITKSFSLITTIAAALHQMGIELPCFHSEAGAGQYEFVLPPLPPVQAVDALVQARQCIQILAASQGVRATCHPMPFPGIGTAAHAHISLNSGAGRESAAELENLEMSFMASILEHLPALCAFTMPQAVSYGRVADDSWTGGTWVAWGTQNRETPLRRAGTVDCANGKGSRWEVRCLDGMANMYLALGAILGAGLAGIRGGSRMTLKDCTSNPTKLSGEQKRELGITQKLPASFQEALDELKQDDGLDRILAPGLVHHYTEMKKAEQEMLNLMPEKERRLWLIERY